MDGYHGTSKTKAQEILKSRKYRISGDNTDWLGRGVYFFENDDHQAFMFSKYKNKLDVNDVSVLYTQIDFGAGKIIIDLTIDKDRKFINDYAKTLRAEIRKLELETGKWKHPEGYVLDSLFKVQHYDVVRANYETPKSRRRRRNLLGFIDSQLQVCVKNLNCIDSSSIKEVDCSAYRTIQKRGTQESC